MIDQKTQTNQLSYFWLQVINLLISTAAAMYWPVSAQYMVNTLGENYTTMAVVLAIASLLGMTANFIAGRLFDHWKPYYVLLMFLSLGTISTTALIHFNGWPIYVPLAWTLSFTAAGTTTLLYAYGSTVANKQMSAQRAFSNMFIVGSIAVVLGTAVVSFLYEWLGLSVLMMIAALLFLSSLILALIHFPKTKPVVKKPQASLSAEQTKAPFKPAPLLWAIVGLNMLFVFVYQFWETVMGPHMTGSLGLPYWNFGVLWVLNGTLIMLFQRMISNRAERHPFRQSIVLGALVFGGSFLPLIWADQFWEILLIFVVLTIGEMMFTPQVPAWADQLVEPQYTGRVQGLIQMSSSAGRLISPLYAGVMIDHGYYTILYVSAFVMIVLMSFFVWQLSNKKTSA